MNLGEAKKPYTKRERHFTICRGKGSGRGKTGGRGGKGQSARAGYSRREYFEGGTMPLVRRLPKRGFNNFNFEHKVAEVNLRDLNRFVANDTVNPDKLVAAGIVRHGFEWVKVLACGQIDRPLTVAAHRFSAEAEAAIQKAGGKVEWLTEKPKAEEQPAPPAGPKKTAAEKKAARKAKKAAARAAKAAPEAKAGKEGKGKEGKAKEGKPKEGGGKEGGQAKEKKPKPEGEKKPKTEGEKKPS